MDSRPSAAVARLAARYLAATAPPTSIRDWMLYDQPGAGEAASALTAALKDAQKALHASLSKYRHLDPEEHEDAKEMLGGLINQAYRQHMVPVIRQYKAVGAGDTESRHVALKGLVDAAKQFYGIRGSLDLWEYI